jgi:putative endonuclease
MMLFNKKTKAAHLSRGEEAEEQAHRYLLDAGLQPVARNFRCKQGELDLIMREARTLVIIEVRYRQSDRYGSAEESVTAAKQAKLIAATQLYLATHKTDCPIRFDVVAISGDGKLNWIKNAF